MKTLRELLDGMDYELVKGSLDVPVGDIIYDSRKECGGNAFVCIRGTKIDSHDFIPDVAARGAAAVIIERDVPVEADITVVQVPAARKALAELSAAHFDHPTRKMTTIGLTGTKGKTTSTYMLKAILEAAGKKVGLVGTNGAVIAGEHFTTNNTTPESYELQQYFHRMVEAGCEYMIMEVSSQGLMMDRVAGIHFDIGVFTNITPDHIGPGEHSSFEEYRAWKGELFKRCDIGIVNRDDPNCEALLAGHTCEIRTFGQKEEDDFRATEIRHLQNGSFMGVSFMLSGKYGSFPVEVGIPGLFSVYNALGALGAALTLGISQEAILSALKSIRVNGRMELVYASDRFSVIVDYAHNGVSTRSLLETLRDYNPKRLVVVFGCGGNRDPHRRYEMGEVAGEMADLSIVTADNSRFEKVEDIIADIHIGLDPTGGAFVDIPDRREAIRYSIEQAQPGDVIAIIGKGHEDYQEVRGVKTHFSDREEAEAVLRELGLQ
ncbi:MAG: UDP-N-acetylmuramoyl-L-alanyl-D-glutamate--2,6-diaminopimelate ligase [Lachnospiraceae bacterium]|nr:UDP-N-acetylmuramoyl-L-alanyl-D-glutamate--2,6-diaminopimelate ligase [Lachnospiraceae bacterium]